MGNIDQNNTISYINIGKKGESCAQAHLRAKGYRILDRNIKFKNLGEIDIVAQKRKELIFAEVKTSMSVPGSAFIPEQRVSRKKQRVLKHLAEIYMRENRFDADTPWRIDVISVILDKDGNLFHINHIENAVWETQY